MLRYVSDESCYQQKEGQYQGQMNEQNQKHGIGIWKPLSDDDEITQVYGEWQFDKLFNGYIKTKDGVDERINYRQDNNDITLTNVLLKVGLLKEISEKQVANAAETKR